MATLTSVNVGLPTQYRYRIRHELDKTPSS